ncbi:16S rRNA (uracil(1498)-N(3))-methyltransferase [Thiolapillus sp.]
MRLPRNWIPLPLAVGDELQLPTGAARHVQQVLRMQPGQEIILFNGLDGRDYRATLVQVGKKAVTTRIASASEVEPPAQLSIRLALGISRSERMDLALQKSVELGVQQITPLFTERTQIKLSPQRQQKRLQHWQGIIINACEQCGRRWLPVLHPPQNYHQWLERKEGNILFLDPGAGSSLPDIKKPEASLCFLSGPEGGFSEEEKTAAIAAGCTLVRLGPRVLRTETAPLAAIAAAQALWGDFL